MADSGRRREPIARGGGKQAMVTDREKSVDPNGHPCPDATLALYDLASDSGEERDVAAAHPDIVAVLHACVGIHRCTIRDYQPWNPQYHRRGLLQPDDTPYPLLIDSTRRTNEQVFRLVYAPAH